MCTSIRSCLLIRTLLTCPVSPTLTPKPPALAHALPDHCATCCFTCVLNFRLWALALHSKTALKYQLTKITMRSNKHGK